MRALVVNLHPAALAKISLSLIHATPLLEQDKKTQEMQPTLQSEVEKHDSYGDFLENRVVFLVLLLCCVI